MNFCSLPYFIVIEPVITILQQYLYCNIFSMIYQVWNSDVKCWVKTLLTLDLCWKSEDCFAGGYV